MTWTIADHHRAAHLAALVPTLLGPERDMLAGHGLLIARLPTMLCETPTLHVGDLQRNECVLSLTQGAHGCCLRHYLPGPWEQRLEAWAQEGHAAHPLPGGEEPDRVQVTLDLAAEIFAEAAACEHLACLDDRTLTALERLGCAALRAAEWQRAAQVMGEAPACTTEMDPRSLLGRERTGRNVLLHQGRHTP